MNIYNQTAVVYRDGTTTTDSIGGYSRNKAIHLASVACRVRMLKAQEREMSGSRGVSVSHRMYCSVVDIVETDEIHIGNTVYDVQVVNNVDGMGHHLKIDLLERRPERGV